MLADLVEVTTPDGFSLSGAYFAPKPSPEGRSVEALLFFHGDGGNFYSPLCLGLGDYLAQRGVAVLTANRRGHDTVARGAADGTPGGYAFESVESSSVDYGAWLSLLTERGHTRVAIGGHSGGAVRSVYARAVARFPEVLAVVSVSPGEYNHEVVRELHGDDFAGPFAEAEQNLLEGRPDTFLKPGVPWGSMWTARTYVDCFNRNNRYSVSAHAANTGCPTLFVFGSEECAGPQVLPVCGAAQRRLTASGLDHVAVEVVDGANHGYAGREAQLYRTIGAWIESL